jgi:uncharacterized delta-60 repeat protein
MSRRRADRRYRPSLLPLEARSLLNGSLDVTFRSGLDARGGQVLYAFPRDAELESVAIQPDGKVVAVGGAWTTPDDMDLAVARFLPDGTPDASFGTAGRVVIPVQANLERATNVAFDPDGRIYVLGAIAYGNNLNRGLCAVVVLDRNGRLDPGFNGGAPRLLTDFNVQASSTFNWAGPSIAVRRLGGRTQIVVVGTNAGGLTVMKLNANGSADATFGQGGRAFVGRPSGHEPGYAVALLDDGRVVVGGGSSLYRLRADGSADPTFGTAGRFDTLAPVRITGWVVAMTVLPDGSIIALGQEGDLGTARVLKVLPNGTLDPGFGNSGWLGLDTLRDARRLAYDPVTATTAIVGSFWAGAAQQDFAVARLLANGQLDQRFGTILSGGIASVGFDSPRTTSSPDRGRGIAIQPDGKIVIGGTVGRASAGRAAEFALARLTVPLTPVAVGLEVDAPAIAYGDRVAITATVSPPVATGTIRFLDGGIPLAAVALVNGRATFETTALPVGNRSITARYEPSGPFSAAVATRVVTVSAVATTTTLEADPAEGPYGDVVHLAATVRPVPPGGVVRFLAGTTVLGEAEVISGGARLDTRAIDAGGQAITAVFQGSPTHARSESPARVVTRTPRETTTTLGVAPETLPFGRTLALTATVESAPMVPAVRGQVAFRRADGREWRAAVIDGRAQVLLTDLPVGEHEFTATFEAGRNFQASASAARGVRIEPATTAVTLRVDGTVAFGRTVQVVARVATEPRGATPAGAVTFLVDGAPVGTVTLSGGEAALPLALAAAGPLALRAEFAGGPGFLDSAATAAVEVPRAATTTVLEPIAGPVAFGTPVSLRARVEAEGDAPAGRVAFFDGPTELGTAELVGGLAAWTVATPAVGNRLYRVAFQGGPNHAPSEAPSQRLVVQPASTTTAARIEGPVVAGRPIRLRVTVAAGSGTPAGNVVALVNGRRLDPRPLVDGQAALDLPPQPEGALEIVVRYEPGSAGFVASATPPIRLPIARLTSTTALAASAATVPAGRPVTLVATVRIAGEVPTGVVVFRDGDRVLGQAPVGADGRATLTVTGLAEGTRPLRAGYEGATSFAPSTSNVASVTVTPITPQPTAPRVVSVDVARGNRPTLTITFDQPLDPARAQNARNFEVRRNGRPLAVTAVRYDAARRAIVLTLGGPVTRTDRLRLVAFAANLASPRGLLLDGNGDGRAGDNYVRDGL